MARITDLSELGCYVDSLNETLPGEILHLKVQLPDGDWLDLAGEVVHSFASVGFGLRFTNMNEAHLTRLHWLLASLEQLDHQPASLLCA